jgi:hypothetical protein
MAGRRGVIAKAAACAAFLTLDSAAVWAASASAGAPAQLLPLPAITAAPTLAPPTSAGITAAPPERISPLLLGPAFQQPPAEPNTSPAALPAPIDQQKTSSYQMWLEGQQRLLERGSAHSDDVLGRQIQQQLLQLEQSAGLSPAR